MGGCPLAAGTALVPERHAAAPAGLGCADPGPSGCDRCPMGFGWRALERGSVGRV